MWCVADQSTSNEAARILMKLWFHCLIWIPQSVFLSHFILISSHYRKDLSMWQACSLQHEEASRLLREWPRVVWDTFISSKMCHEMKLCLYSQHREWMITCSEALIHTQITLWECLVFSIRFYFIHVDNFTPHLKTQKLLQIV